MKKNTEELLHTLKNSPDLDTYFSQEENNLITTTLPDYLKALCEEKNISKAQCAKVSGLDRTYVYQIFSGAKHPTRDKLLALCFGFSLDLEETQNLLKSTSYPILYAKNKRDSAIIFALERKYTLIELNELLFEMELKLIE